MARKCFICKKKDDPINMFIDGILKKVTCRDPDCMTAYSLWKLDKQKKANEKVKTRQHKEAKEKLNDTVSFWTKKTQVVFNKYVRLRDSKMPCVSCGKPAVENCSSLTGSNWDCGHYRSRGAAPELRFEVLNAHKQCVKCNQYKSGNIVEYRMELIKRIGPINLEWLEGPHEAKRYKVPELKEIHKYFHGMAKDLENAST